jgi:hypothetical protein
VAWHGWSGEQRQKGFLIRFPFTYMVIS